MPFLGSEMKWRNWKWVRGQGGSGGGWMSNPMFEICNVLSNKITTMDCWNKGCIGLTWILWNNFVLKMAKVLITPITSGHYHLVATPLRWGLIGCAIRFLMARPLGRGSLYLRTIFTNGAFSLLVAAPSLRNRGKSSILDQQVCSSIWERKNWENSSSLE